MSHALLVNPSRKRRKRSSTKRRGAGSRTRRRSSSTTRRKRRSSPRRVHARRRRAATPRRRYRRRSGFARATVTLRNPHRRSGGGGGTLKQFGKTMADSLVPAGVVVVGLLGPAIAVDAIIQQGWIEEKTLLDDKGNPSWKRYVAEGIVVGVGWYAARKFKGGRYAQLVAISGLAGIGVRAYMNMQAADPQAQPEDLSLATWGQGAQLFAPKTAAGGGALASGTVGTITRIDSRLGTIERVANF